MSKLHPEQWLDEYGDVLYRFALARLRSPDAAEEAVQDTLLAAWEKRDAFEGKASVLTWLTAILRNKIVDQIRRRTREQAHLSADAEALDTLFQADGSHAIPVARWTRDASSSAESEEFWTAFHECLAALPERAANAFVMREIDGMDGKEICKVLDMSSSNYWVVLHRARLQLRECLERTWFSGERG